jgi:HAD superfamily hydrolase (TIGR01509 family)
MIKGIIFDLDGVLVDTKIIHYNALNLSLQKYEKIEISLEDHSKIYDGLTTNEKLGLLVKNKKIKKKNLKKIVFLKKKITKKLLKDKIKFNPKVYNLFKTLKKEYKLAIATNAIKSTLTECIKYLKISKFIDYKLSNEEVRNPKPHPEIYLRCLIGLDLKPKETLVVEDSHHGREAAKESGCNIYAIKNMKDLNLKNINLTLKEYKKKHEKTPWIDKELNVIIPMAGKGSRFASAGYTFPKPLIEIAGKPMIQCVIENLNLIAKFIFIIQKKHQQKNNIVSLLKTLIPDCEIIILDKVTEGAACTVLLAKRLINNKRPLLIANSDQYIVWNSNNTLYKFHNRDYDGGIITFKASHPKWSYARTDDTNMVLEVAEKKVISNNATTGIYFWKKGSDYVKYAEKMIEENNRVNNEFYVCPVFNYAIKDKKKIYISEVEEMYGLGTPEDLKFFIQKKVLNQ